MQKKCKKVTETDIDPTLFAVSVHVVHVHCIILLVYLSI